MQQTPATFFTWWRAFRFHFIPPSFLPAMLGGVLAWAITGQFNALFYFLTVLGVTLNHIALNMTDDYFDYIASVDRAKDREKNPYSGGSGTLTSGLIQPGQMRTFFTLAYILTVVIGIYLSIAQSYWIFVFGLFGMMSAYFYTAPPIRYGYHGFGEVSQLVNFSFTIGIGAYVAQTVSFSWEAFWVVLPLGFMMFAMITINEIPDLKDDKAGGKNNLVVLFGAETAARLYGISMIAAFFIILFAPVFGLASFWIYLSLITFPWFIRALKILYQNYTNPVKLAPANLLTIRIHNLVGILLILAYIIQGFQNQHDIWQMVVPVVTLVVFYTPVAFPVFFMSSRKSN